MKVLTKSLFPIILYGEKYSTLHFSPTLPISEKNNNILIYEYLLTILKISSRLPDVIDTLIKKTVCLQ